MRDIKERIKQMKRLANSNTSQGLAIITICNNFLDDTKEIYDLFSVLMGE